MLQERDLLKTFGPLRPLKIVKEENRKRRDKIKYLKSIGVKSYDRDKKLYTGEISPGCQACRKGTWACMFINVSCTRDCFFCPQERPEKPKKNERTIIETSLIKSNKDLTGVLKGLGSNACGISGGEPLLAINKAVRFITCMRNTFGPTFKIHLYTNGDLAGVENLKALKQAGLDEIRFNLSANGYNLKPVRTALKYISDVTVEIPVIPKHEKRLYNLLALLDKLKVKYINLHELSANSINISRIRKQGYMVKNDKILPLRRYGTERPIHGSEEAAFRLLEFIIKRKLSISVNYCSMVYKKDIQVPKRMVSAAKMIHKNNAVVKITRNGFIKKILVCGPGLNRIAEDLKRNGVPEEEIVLDNENARLETHVDNLCYLSPEVPGYSAGVSSMTSRYNPRLPGEKYRDNEIGVTQVHPNGGIIDIETVR
jgi:pyruvate formate-lyase activating enzyme-like uncharacterized protein